MKNLKTTIITALLMFAAVSGAVAQEKWEYAMIFIDPGGKLLIHKVNNTEHQSIKLESKFNNFYGQTQELLNQVSKATDEGWEVINASASTNISINIFYLKRKKK